MFNICWFRIFTIPDSPTTVRSSKTWSKLFEGISVRWKKLSISSVPADGFCHQERSNWPPGSCGGQGNRVWPKKLQKSKK